MHVEHKGFYNTLAQKLFHTPRVSHIELERFGSFLWKEIDGEKTVGSLAECFKAQFGEEAEPLYERLVKYMGILYKGRFVLYKGRDKL